LRRQTFETAIIEHYRRRESSVEEARGGIGASKASIPYIRISYLDGIVMKRTWAGEVRNVSFLVASAVNSEGFREIPGICEGAKEDKSG
jgi:putative transposase